MQYVVRTGTCICLRSIAERKTAVASTDNDVQRLVAHISRHKSKSLALQLAIEQEKAKQAELTEEIRIIHTIQTKCSVSETTNIPAVSNSSPPQDTLQLDFDDSASTASPLSEPSATPPTNPRTKAAIASLSDKDALRFAAHISRHKSKVLALKLAIQQEKNQASSTAERH
ncbi:hypothetical protein FB45DRAFT_113627 [Roridomyces roridus]|uniref:Uncharacterized protein n=1 Tax=Roridomyces roridus TaxID=1738132 RepID=A0AAD7FJM1_9AGAR|nr:hypothetical protein FB45DRAFT_113627 [Roridomyces roridus]